MNCEVRDTFNRPNSEGDQIDAYLDRFEGIGSFRPEFHTTIDRYVPPVVQSLRRCPLHLKDGGKPELDEMDVLGVITKVSAPNIVYSRKSNNKMHICLDPKDLNRVINRPRYKMPTLDEITPDRRIKSALKRDARHEH